MLLSSSWLAPLLIVLTARNDCLSGVSAEMFQTWKDGILYRVILGMEYGVCELPRIEQCYQCYSVEEGHIDFSISLFRISIRGKCILFFTVHLISSSSSTHTPTLCFHPAPFA